MIRWSRGRSTCTFGGTSEDAVCLVGLLEAAVASARYEWGRLTSVSVLDVSVQAAVDARAREVEVRAAIIDAPRNDSPGKCMIYGAPLVALKRSRRLKNGPKREQRARWLQELRGSLRAGT